MNLTGRPIPQKTGNGGKDPAHLARVAALPCIICHTRGEPQLSPTQVHHVIHGRHSTRKVPDTMTIPLCEGHHLGQWDASKIAVHREPNLWRETYGHDTDWLDATAEMIGGR